MITVYLSPKEIHIILQALRILMQEDADGATLAEYAKVSELNHLRMKLNNVKG